MEGDVSRCMYLGQEVVSPDVPLETESLEWSESGMAVSDKCGKRWQWGGGRQSKLR